MNIVNHTQSTVFWSVSSPGQGDCGSLAPNESFYLPVQEGPTYQVSFSAQDPKDFRISAQANQTVSIAVAATAPREAEEAQPEAAAAG